MPVALVNCSWYFAPGQQAVSLRAIGLVALAVAAYFAFFTPRWIKASRHARMAQLAVALYTILTALAAGTVILIARLFSPAWYSGAGLDRLASSGGVMLIATTFLVGAMLAIPSSRTFAATRIHVGAALAFPFLAAVAMDGFMLAYFWLSPVRPVSTAACSAGPAQSGEYVVAGFSLAVALVAIAASLVPLLKESSLRTLVLRAAVPAAIGAAIEIGLVIVRGPQHWSSTSHLAGVDLMLACALIGIWVFLAGLRSARNHFAPRPVRLENRWFSR